MSVERSAGVIILQDVMSGAGEEAREVCCGHHVNLAVSRPHLSQLAAVLWCHSSIHSTELAESYITFYCENQQLKLQ